MGQPEKETKVAEVIRSMEELLQWAEAHPGCTLRELEERIQEWKTRVGVQVLEAAVVMQGTGRGAEGTCSCGGEWVFQGYRERHVMTSQGGIRVKRAYFTCERCGQGFFPPGPGEGDSGGLE
jgi:hypothetical protein